MDCISLENKNGIVNLLGALAVPGLRAARLEPSSGAGEQVDDTIEILMEGSRADIESAMAAIGRMLAAAGEYANPLYLNCRPDAAGELWRSQVRSGWLEVAQPGSNTRGRGAQASRLHLTRENAWESSEKQAALATPALPGGTLAAAQIFNADDALRWNWVEIAAETVGGELGAPARVEIINTYAQELAYVWIGLGRIDSVDWAQVLEAEDAPGGEVSMDVSCSGGARATAVVNNPFEQTLFRWTLSAEALSQGGGRWVHGVLRFASGTSDALRYRLKLMKGGLTVWQSEQVTARMDTQTCLRDWFVLRLPPGAAGITAYEPLDLALTGQLNSGASAQAHLDFLALTPAEGWRCLYAPGGIAAGGSLVDDGISGAAYSASAAGECARLQAAGEPLRLSPGARQRLYFWLHTSGIDQGPVEHSAGVKVFYRERRRAL